SGDGPAAATARGPIVATGDRALLAAFVVVAHEAVEQAHAVAGGAFGHGRRVARGPVGAGDVQVRPRQRAVHPFADEVRAGTGTGRTAAVAKVGDRRLQPLAVFLAQRHPPQFLAA